MFFRKRKLRYHIEKTEDDFDQDLIWIPKDDDDETFIDFYFGRGFDFFGSFLPQ